MTTAEMLAEAERRLAHLGIGAEAAREARLILAHAAGWSGAGLLANLRDRYPDRAASAAREMLHRRERREPLPQILGSWHFYGRDFEVCPDVLTPRPDTETLIELALAAPFSRLLDLGTGSGAIAVTLLAERPQARGLATDISGAALAVARSNARRLGVADRLDFLQSDWFAEVSGTFDLIVSNPPYVAEADYADLAPEITEWEPKGALTPGGDGLDAYRAILAGAAAHMSPGARLLVEIGHDQGPPVADLFRAAGLAEVAIHPDINGKMRVVGGRSPG